MDWRIVREHPSSLCFEGGVHHNASLSSGPWMSCRTEPESLCFSASGRSVKAALF